jgi:hypothetical protein
MFLKMLLQGWGCSSVVECLTSIHRSWVWEPAPQKKKKNSFCIYYCFIFLKAETIVYSLPVS